MMDKTTTEREIYEGRLKARRDRAAELRGARLAARIWAFQEILKLPATAEEELYAQTVEELTKLAEALKKQIESRVGQPDRHS